MDSKTKSQAMIVAGKSMSIGAGAGLLGSLVGLGGGFVAIPALTGWLRLTQHQAHGTSLGAVFATGAAGSAAYGLAGHVDYGAAGAIAIGGMVGAHLGARSTAGISPSALKLALGLLMMGVAPLLPLRSRFLKRPEETTPGEASAGGSSDGPLPRADERVDKVMQTGVQPSGAKLSGENPSGENPSEAKLSEAKPSEAKPSGAKPSEAKPSEAKPSEAKPSEAPHEVDEHGSDGTRADGGVMAGLVGALRMCGIGLGSGFLAGVFGVGGGIVMIPAISFLTDLSHKEVLGTSLAAMVLPALTGSVTHLRQGNLLPRVAVPLALGTGVGAFLGGSHAARYLDETSLKWGFSCMMVFLGAKTVSGARAMASIAKGPTKPIRR